MSYGLTHGFVWRGSLVLRYSAHVLAVGGTMLSNRHRGVSCCPDPNTLALNLSQVYAPG